MKKYLLPPEGNWYKANLHCHTNVSDGSFSPERVKEEYKKRGYSIVAYTDHQLMVDHSDLGDKDFLPLIGWEYEVCEDKPWREHPLACHICFIALDNKNPRQHVMNGSKYLEKAKGYADRFCFDPENVEMLYDYSTKSMTEVMQKGREAGFFVTYNHPAWSLETRDQYTNYHGMNAMEICNYGCYEAGYEDYNAYIYDDMLRAGERIYCIATDDNHNGGQGDDAFHDSFGGFTMIRAESLDYCTVTSALERGDFYASMGPEIYEAYLEDDAVHIKCSPAKTIALHGGVRVSWAKHAKGDELLTEAVFPLYGLDLRYIRLSVTDKEGKRANTNAYFTDTL